MERQYIFFKTSKAFWFCLLAFLLFLISLPIIAIKLKPESWLVISYIAIASFIIISVAFKLDSKKTQLTLLNENKNVR